MTASQSSVGLQVDELDRACTAAAASDIGSLQLGDHRWQHALMRRPLPAKYEKLISMRGAANMHWPTHPARPSTRLSLWLPSLLVSAQRFALGAVRASSTGNSAE